jgi:CubicO group peptidase (beta-lactamase class C family)
MQRNERSYLWLGALAGAVLVVACGGCGSDSSRAPDTPKGLLDACPKLTVPAQPAASLGAVVDKLVAKEMNEQGLPGMTVTISKGGTILYARGYGYADLKTCRRAQADTEYAIGSVTKQFTATAVLRLQSEGKVELDAPVADYLSLYGVDPRITVRMLLNQTSGLADYLGFPGPPNWLQGIAQSTVLTAIAAAPLDFTPGTAYAYSNSNYYLLGVLVETVTGESYAGYITSQILTPLGLIHTSFEQSLTAALPYTYTNPAVPGTTGLAEGVIPDPSVYFAAGALWSNGDDLSRWNAALLNGQVIAPSQFIQMVTPPAGIPDFQQAGVDSTYAMGWVQDQIGTHPMIWHNGQTLAYTAFNSMFLDDGFSVSILVNVDVQESTPLQPLGYAIMQGVCEAAATAASC